MATTFSELWDEIKTAALNEVQVVKNDLVQWEGKIVPVVETDLVTVLSQLKGLAISLVTQFATAEFANLTGVQKQAITVTSLVQSAIASGKTLAVQDAQVLAQQAYNAVQYAVGSSK